MERDQGELVMGSELWDFEARFCHIQIEMASVEVSKRKYWGWGHGGDVFVLKEFIIYQRDD